MGLKAKLRRWYWDHMDTWWLSTVERFLKGLSLLVLWLVAAFGLFLLVYRFVLPGFKVSPKEEPLTLLIPLVTALLGFAVQQWKGLEEEWQRRRRAEEEALKEVYEFPSLLKKDLSEGARRYLELRERLERAWQSPRVQYILEKTWRENAPPELQVAIVFWSEEGKKRIEEAREALLWAYEHLDEDWRQRIAERFLGISEGLEFVIQHWQAILTIWPDVSLGQCMPKHLDADLIQGIRYLGIKESPFGYEKAEDTPDLLKTPIYPAWWAKVSDDTWGLYITLPKGGRTATALFLAYDALRKQKAFPVYWRVNRDDFDLKEIAVVMARATARYIAVRPGAFINLPPLRKRAITELLKSCLGEELTGYLHRAGLPRVGEGKRVAEELTTLVQDVLIMSPSQREWLALLSEARPYDFPHLLILADVQGPAGEDTALKLYRLGEGLNRASVILKAFVATDDPGSLEAYGEFIYWRKGDLKDLLYKRLEYKRLREPLEAWCDLRRWEGPSAEERVLQAAQGRPGELIRLGNELLRRIGQKRQLLTPEDFKAVLGAAQ